MNLEQHQIITRLESEAEEMRLLLRVAQYPVDSPLHERRYKVFFGERTK